QVARPRREHVERKRRWVEAERRRESADEDRDGDRVVRDDDRPGEDRRGARVEDEMREHGAGRDRPDGDGRQTGVRGPQKRTASSPHPCCTARKSGRPQRRERRKTTAPWKSRRTRASAIIGHLLIARRVAAASAEAGGRAREANGRPRAPS